MNRILRLAILIIGFSSCSGGSGGSGGGTAGQPTPVTEKQYVVTTYPAASSAAWIEQANGIALTPLNEVLLLGSSNITKLESSGGFTHLYFSGSPACINTSDGNVNGPGFNNPKDLIYDSAGNMFVVEATNIRKITVGGIVEIFAGHCSTLGTIDGTGTAARFKNAKFITIDFGGNLYVADNGACTLRKITAAGVVTTVAGIPNTCARAWTTSSGKYIPTSLEQITGLTRNSINEIFISTGNDIIKMNSDGTFEFVAFGEGAGTFNMPDGVVPGVGQLNNPLGISADLAGNIFIAENRHVIRKINTNSILSTIAGNKIYGGILDGVDFTARFDQPSSIKVGSNGVIYILDFNISGSYGSYANVRLMEFKFP